MVSATQAGRSWFSTSIVQRLVTWKPPPRASHESILIRMRIREPTGTVLVKTHFVA